MTARDRLMPDGIPLHEQDTHISVNAYRYRDGDATAQINARAGSVAVSLSGITLPELDQIAAQIADARSYLNPGHDTGADLIAAERRRQLAEEGWTAAHDDLHTDHDLNFAAQAYCQEAIEPGTWPAVESPGGHVAPPTWPWEAGWWKPSDDPVRNLVKAGALIAAEIDRLHRAAAADADRSALARAAGRAGRRR